ncbi:hypothetical protein CO229_02580 [Mycoplasmopsis bovirhinis]|uniref:hypothetical protein n=1 Tax=Mycoplasmopsis bovirhinis TaxID=29553 RepID=UPI000C05AD64|nr:hypothetical protein [Mycoplasmopsis bovirhinis]ATO30985.1 hypothetical protein CO229_02580 [Mycoplasmopsis bovirhinis]
MKDNKPKLDFIKLRIAEIEYARKKAEQELLINQIKKTQEKLPIAKQELFRNIIWSILIIIIVISLLVGAYFIGNSN